MKMHVLTIARTKDFPFWEVLEQALSYDDSNDEYIGKWEQIYANQEELVAENIDEINELLEENDGNFNEAVSAYMDRYRLKVGDDEAIYENMSAIFDYCCLGGRFASEDQIITQYKNIQEVDAFVTADFAVHYTDEEECPFDADDMIYVIDGHN